MASSNSIGSPCAACKLLRRKCTQECIFAPHFPPTQVQKFECVHKVFGASNVAKLLSELPFDQRGDAVTSLVFEAELNLKNPVYGPAGLLSYLQQHLKQVQDQLAKSKEELATYVGPDQAMRPIIQTQQQPFEAQQLAAVNAVAREQEQLFRAYGGGGGGGSNIPHHQNQPQVDISKFNSGFDSVPTGLVTVAGGTTVTGMPPYVTHVDDNYHTDQQLHHQQQELFEAQQLAAVNAVAREQEELFRAYGGSNIPYHQNQPQVDSGFDCIPTGSVTVAGFNQLGSGGTNVTGMPPYVAVGGNFVGDNYHTEQQQQEQHGTQLFIPTESFQSLSFQPQEIPIESSPVLPLQMQETQMFMPTQSSQSLPFQPQETQMFMPTQPSHSLPHQTHETHMFMPTHSSHSLPHQTHETQVFMPTHSSHSLPHQTHETHMFMPTQSSHSQPHQTQETQMFTPTQPSQMLPPQTRETQMFTPTQSSFQSIPHQTQERQIFKPTQSSLAILLETQETQTQTNSESEGGKRPWLVTKKLEFKK